MWLVPFLILLTFFSSAHALYMGNPAEPEVIDEGFFLSKNNWWALKAGYQGDYIFDRKLKVGGVAKARIDEFKALTNQGVLTFGVLERLEAYASVGSMNAFFTERPEFDGKRREYQTSEHLTWGAGTRLIVFQWGELIIGVDAAFQHARPHLRWNSLNGESFSSKAKLNYNEWQASGGFAYHIDYLIPYIAVKYSSVSAQLRHILPNMELKKSHFTMHSRRHFGMALGCSLSNAKYVDLNIEIQLVDEEAISLAGNIQF